MTKKSKAFAILSYICVLVIISLIYGKKDRFVMFHAKQGVGILLLWVVAPYVLWIPILGWIAGPILMALTLVLAVYGIVYVAKGEEKPVPLVGKYIEKILF